MKNEVANLVINGFSNQINATNKKCEISNVVFNGSDNSIEVRKNRHINNIQNGSNNIIFTKRNNNNLILNNNNNNNSANNIIIRNNNINTSVFNYKGQNISLTLKGNNDEISKKINKNLFFYRPKSAYGYNRISDRKAQY